MAFAGSSVSAAEIHFDGLRDGERYDRFIVKYRDGAPEAQNAAALQRALERASVGAQQMIQAQRAQAGRIGAGDAKPLQIGHLRRLSVGGEVVRTNRKLSRAEAQELMRQLAAHPNVEYVEVDQLMKAIFTPNDTRYSEQWGYFNATGGIRADQAWDVSTGAGVVVAVLDTGSTNHSDLNGNTIAGYDMISDSTVAGDGNGRDSDPSDPGDYYGGYPSSWHGTHVAGTVAAVTNNAKGVAGTAFGAKVQHVRVLGRGGGYTSDIVDGITWASGGTVSGVPANPTPAEVINMSLGGSGSCSSTYQNAINAAVNRGTTIVVAAGNSNTNVSNAVPANCQNVIAVAATDINGSRASFSNYGSGIDISAPGVNILSTLNSGSTSPGSESYASYNGTSMAAPHVAGVVALMQAAASTPLTPSQVESIIKSTARPLPGSCSGGCGAGIVNAKAAVDAVTGGGGDPGPGPNELTKGVPVTGLSASTGNDIVYTMTVPSGASNLSFSISGGTGDADLYVKYGSAPTDSSYDCRPYLNGNSETCSFASPAAGTYYVRVKAYSSFSGVSLVGDYSTGGGGSPQTYSNGTDYAINDLSTVESPITVSGRSGNAPSSTSVAVDIRHTYIGDLRVDLVAPDGSVYNLHNRSGGSADNIIRTYTVNLSSEALNGTWRLRVSDNARRDTGYINSWSITF
ncbi:S8 family serine peptidase [Arenimonas fontis]|uniref:S8 family serine peptidase n=1 Tax=Arenimonas fontis TaxID=2608255 RepID=A0A5B2Z7Q3_9GAMM|nr:S8 family serine peptidase [Arenimonas fontis]